MKRAWHPIDIGGLRLYEVKVEFPMHPNWNSHHIIASTSPRHAAELYRKLNADTNWIEEPIISGHALNVYQPAEWWSDGIDDGVDANLLFHELANLREILLQHFPDAFERFEDMIASPLVVVEVAKECIGGVAAHPHPAQEPGKGEK